jgi:FlgD Ig-like domain
VRAADAPISDSTAFANAPLRISLRATKDPGQTETLAFDGLARSHTYWFALRAIDLGGLESGVSNTVSATTHSGGGGGPLAGVTGPAIACLAQPSRVPASLYWQSENAGAAQNIRLFDLNGRRLRTLPLGGEASGVATWDGRDEDGRLLPAGIYFARLTSGSLHAQTRVVLLP